MNGFDTHRELVFYFYFLSYCVFESMSEVWLQTSGIAEASVYPWTILYALALSSKGSPITLTILSDVEGQKGQNTNYELYHCCKESNQRGDWYYYDRTLYLYLY